MVDDERDLLEQVSAWTGHGHWSELTRDALQTIACDKGIDFATALLFDRLVRSPEHGPFIDRIDRLRQQDGGMRLPGDILVAVVPGAFYREHPETGADGRAIRDAAEAIGCRTARVPIDSMGLPSANGATLHEWLLAHRDEQVILVSLSKGGADVKMALAQPDATEAFEGVIAWLNVGGMVDGSPMVTWGLQRPLYRWLVKFLFWLRGRDFRFIRDLREHDGPLASELRIPEHLRTIHMIGFPLKRHLSTTRARRWHRRLEHRGPNDAVIVLGDVCRLPGSVLPIWGTDHYLQSGWDAQRLVTALLHYLCDEFNSTQKRLEPSTGVATNVPT